MTSRLATFVLLAASLTTASSAQNTAELAATADATVVSASPNQNDGRGTDLLVGAGDGTTETYVQFDLRAIPRDVTVIAAAFSYDARTVSAPAPRLDLHAVVGKWLEKEITFGTRPATGTFLQSSTPEAGVNQIATSDEFLATIQNWVAQPDSNLGIRIRTETGSEKNPSQVNIVSREGATSALFAPSLDLKFAKVKIETAAIPKAFLGFQYRATLTAATIGVNAVQWELLDNLPSGLSTSAAGTTFFIFGTPLAVERRIIRVELRDPDTGLKDTRSFTLEVATPSGEVRIRNAHEALEAGVFSATDPQPIVALGLSMTNESEFDCALRKVSFRVMGTIVPERHLESASLFLDRDDDGKLSEGDVRVAGPLAFGSDVLPLQMNVDDAALPRLASRSFLLVIQPRPGCPKGVEFETGFGGGGVTEVVFAGTDRASRLSFGRIYGPAFSCEERLGFPGDANGDGKIDCLDVQMLARRLDSAAAEQLDPSRNGVVDLADLDMMQDHMLGRPVVTRVELVTVTTPTGTRRFAKLHGTGLDRVTLSIGGQLLSIEHLFQRDRLLLLELNSLQRGLQEIIVRKGSRTSTPHRFDLG